MSVKVKITGIPLTVEEIENERERYSKLAGEDLTNYEDSFDGSIIFVSDDLLHIKRPLPIEEDPEVLGALQIYKKAKESCCNTVWDKMGVYRL